MEGGGPPGWRISFGPSGPAENARFSRWPPNTPFRTLPQMKDSPRGTQRHFCGSPPRRCSTFPPVVSSRPSLHTPCVLSFGHFHHPRFVPGRVVVGHLLPVGRAHPPPDCPLVLHFSALASLSTGFPSPHPLHHVGVGIHLCLTRRTRPDHGGAGAPRVTPPPPPAASPRPPPAAAAVTPPCRRWWWPLAAAPPRWGSAHRGRHGCGCAISAAGRSRR